MQNRIEKLYGRLEQSMRYITIALAKGRLAKQTMALLEQMGILCAGTIGHKDEVRKPFDEVQSVELKYDIHTYILG